MSPKPAELGMNGRLIDGDHISDDRKRGRYDEA
jgi:hypothetical protein